MSPLYSDFLPFLMKGKPAMLWTSGKMCDLGILTLFFRTQRSQAVSSGAWVPSCLYSERRLKLQIKAKLSKKKKKADKLKCQSSTSPKGAFFIQGAANIPQWQQQSIRASSRHVLERGWIPKLCTLLTSALLSILQQNSPRMHLVQWAVENGI